MASLELLLRVSVVIFMAGSLAAAGAAVMPRDVVGPLRQPRFVARLLLASWVLPPLIAVALLRVVRIDPGYATGLLLLALAPCAPFAPAMARKAGGDVASIAAVMAFNAIVTVIVVPIAVPLLPGGLSADPMTIAAPLLNFVLLPLAAGVALRAARPQAAEWLIRQLAAVTAVSGGVALLMVVLLYGRSVAAAVGSHAITAQVLFLFAITAAAYGVGAGLPDAQRRTLTLGVCTRNLGAALAPLVSPDADPHSVVMIVIGGPATIGVSMLTARWLAGRPTS